jgi:hypothetical protein
MGQTRRQPGRPRRRELADLIVDMNRVFTKGTPAASTLKFLTHVD